MCINTDDCDFERKYVNDKHTDLERKYVNGKVLRIDTRLTQQ